MKKKPIIWMDLEMTGLYPDRDQIIEIAIIITNSEFEVMCAPKHIIVHVDEDTLNNMDAWNKKQHAKTGLWQKVLKSKVSIEEAEKEVFSYIKSNAPKNCYLAGNSIWQDRRFIRRYMKTVDEYLSYRMIDVTSIKLLCDYWYPDLFFNKKQGHRAVDDIKESIEELKFYKEKAFKD